MIFGLKNKTENFIQFSNIKVEPNKILLMTENALLAISDNYYQLLEYGQFDVVAVNELEEEITFDSREAMHEELRAMIGAIPKPETRELPLSIRIAIEEIPNES